MKAEDVIKQLQLVIPTVTNDFTTQVGIDSIVPAGTTATVTTSTAHGFSVGNLANIAGAFAPVAIDTITRDETIATATTVTPHDITENDLTTEVVLQGATEAEFNGTFPFLTAPNRNTFTFEIDDSGATTATGAPILVDPGSPFGYNGLNVVTNVTGTTTFQYELALTLTESAVGGVLQTNPQITGAATFERAEEMYTAQTDQDSTWAFVVLEDTSVSRDRRSLNDGVTAAGESGSRRQQIFQNVAVYVFTPASTDLSARDARDSMEDVMGYLFSALAFWQAPTYLADDEKSVVFLSHGIEAYSTAWYAHKFEFQMLSDISPADTIDGFDVAFRDIDFTIQTNLGTELLTASVNLDDEPLE